MPIAIGSGVGGLAVGLVVGILFAYAFLRRHLKRKLQANRFVEMPPSTESMFERRGAQYRPVPTTSTAGVTSNSSLLNRLPASPGYQVEAFTMPDELGRAVAPEVRSPSAAYAPPGPARIASMYSDAPAPAMRPSAGHVYVVHHDGSAPPVTIYTQEGTDVVELPPRYPPYSSAPQSEEAARSASATSGSDARNVSESLSLHQVRQPGQVSKPPRSPGKP